MSGRNRPCMHPTISFHVPGGFCGSSIDSLPRIYDSDVDENDVRSKCRRSSGCIGYSYSDYSFTSYVYFSSDYAALNAVSYLYGWERGYRSLDSCVSSCTIDESYTRDSPGRFCYRYSTTTTTGAYVCVCVLIYTTRWVVKEITNGF